MADKVNLLKQNQWEAGPEEELRIPEDYITGLQFEIVTFTEKKTFTFRCQDYSFVEGNRYTFNHVIIDTSKRNAKGDVELKRVTYHPAISLVNVPFMIVPAPEKIGSEEAD